MMHYLIAALATLSALTCACFVAYAASIPVWHWCHPRELRERTEAELHALIHRDALYSGLRFTFRAQEAPGFSHGEECARPIGNA